MMLKKRVSITLFCVVCIVFVSVAVRVLYANTIFIRSVYPDSIGYFLRAQELFASPSVGTLVQYSRTPVFPFILAIPFFMHGQLNGDIQSAEIPTAIFTFIRLQHGVGILTSVLFFFVARKLQFSYLISFFLSVMLGTNLLLIPWERTILTESWGGFWMVLFLFCFVAYIKKPTFPMAAVLAACVTGGILLRPIFLPFGFLFPLVTVVFQKTVRIRLATLSVFFVIAGCIGLYTVINGRFHQAYVFQLVSSINLLGRILGNNIPLGSAASTDMGMKMQAYRLHGYTLDPFAFMPSEYPRWETDPEFAMKLQSFGSHTITASPWHLLRSIAMNLPEALGTVSRAIAIPFGSFRWQEFVLFFLQSVDQVIFSSGILLAPILVVYGMVKKHDFPIVTMVVLGSTALLSIVPTLLYSYEDYARLMTPYVPVFLILFGFAVEALVLFFHLIHRNMRSLKHRKKQIRI